MNDAPPLLTLSDVKFGFPNRPVFLGPVSLTVHRGDCVGIIGPNGAGKSTLLRLMAGLHAPTSGSIALGPTSLILCSGRDRAHRIAYVPQQAPQDLPSSAREIVLMGRFPHRSLGLFESARDFDIAEQVMRETKTLDYADRSMTTLSGGEARRVHLAAALAQHTPLLLLDEPTSSLDLNHELAVFDLLRRRAETQDQAVVVVTHDVNLASRFCTHVVLLSEGRCVGQGAPAEVIRPEVLERVYHVRMTCLKMPQDASRSWIVPLEVIEADAP